MNEDYGYDHDDRDHGDCARHNVVHVRLQCVRTRLAAKSQAEDAKPIAYGP